MSWLDWIRGRNNPSATDAGAPERWLVLDVETTGLDPSRAHLLAIAALAVRVDWSRRTLTLLPGDSLAMTICPEKTSEKSNVLIHGIGVATQRAGMEPAAAMQAFRDWIGDAKLVAYHASFDRTLLGRYARQYLGSDFPNDWLDIAHLCTVAYPDIKARASVAKGGQSAPPPHSASALPSSSMAGASSMRSSRTRWYRMRPASWLASLAVRIPWPCCTSCPR